MGTEPELSSWTDLLHSSTKLLEEVASSAHFPPLQRNLDQLEELSKKLEARTLRTEAHTESIAATRLLAREGIKVEQLPQDLKSFELKIDGEWFATYCSQLETNTLDFTTLTTRQHLRMCSLLKQRVTKNICSREPGHLHLLEKISKNNGSRRNVTIVPHQLRWRALAMRMKAHELCGIEGLYFVTPPPTCVTRHGVARLRAPKLKDCTTLVFPRACRWSSTNTWRHSEVNSVEKIRDMINRLSQNEINWHPWANIEVGNLRRLEIAKKLVQKRVLFCGPSGYAWYLGERAYRQWPGIELPCIPERPPRLMLEPERLSSHDIQRALRGIDAKLFVNRETWGNYCEFMTKQLVCVALTSSGLQKTCLHCDPSSPTHPPMSSSAHPLSSKETDPNSNAGTSSGLKIPPMNVHLPGYPGWSFWDGRIERHIPCPDTVYGVPMTYDYIPGHRYDDLMRMVFGLRLLQIHSSNRITVLELENASYRKKIKELKLGSVEEGSEVEGNEEENSD
ncbi:uncharacterized protein LOC122086086 isoform X3 [Macadamia integrifolia]|uniref:uncharacterized protein LOC122086086 isoform X3 n=1 Tax=Macadamia integrifolia TaxID=60698 RepID=UPI001C4F2819|nr:uncharacterized protein LOC122086086 isoform X3 [Macadamia integrifolia]